ncbi:MAG: ChaN family lipoprotein [Nitrospirales bacterium]|nr:ChaN family lipoprotein [Nitrospira sp.]MDR4500751.1 ChaN family lipoprotein [Nitrospirales bacterium]
MPQQFLLICTSLFVLFTHTACTSTSTSSPTQTNFQVGQIIEVKSGRRVTFDELMSTILNTEVIYIGEEHYTPSHIEAAVQILDALAAHGRSPALAMEMFSWDGQPALDQYTRHHALTRGQFLKDSNWEGSWGGDFGEYERLVQWAKDHRLPLYALNPPRPLVRLVVKKGLEEALQDPAMNNWEIPKDIPRDDAEYKAVIFKPIELCHPGMTKQMYDGYYQASIFRDEGMAKVISDYLTSKSPGEGPLVSYTGGGHIQYEVPVPKRVRRNVSSSIQDVSIYLIALDPSRVDEVQEAIDGGIADYIWLRELGPRGPQPRCG